MLQSVHVADSRPMPRYKHWVIGGVRFTRAHFDPGMWQDMSFPACDGYADIDTPHFQTKGVLFDPNGVLLPREPGWISRNDRWPIPAGIHRRLAIEPAEVWCARPVDKISSLAHVDVFSLAIGDTLDLEDGHELFLATGELFLGPRTWTPFQHLQIVGDEKILTAEQPSYGFVWKALQT